MAGAHLHSLYRLALDKMNQRFHIVKRACCNGIGEMRDVCQGFMC